MRCRGASEFGRAWRDTPLRTLTVLSAISVFAASSDLRASDRGSVISTPCRISVTGSTGVTGGGATALRIGLPSNAKPQLLLIGDLWEVDQGIKEHPTTL